MIELTDAHRRESFSENKNDLRKLVIRLFYPAQISEKLEKYPYLGAKMPYYQKHVASLYTIPEVVSKVLLRNIETHSFMNAPVAIENSAYPVVLFSHGLLGFPSDVYLAILENLASYGYIVVAIDHSYLNGLTLYANGTVVTSQKLSDTFNKMIQKEQKEFLKQAIDVYKADMKFIIDELANLNEDQSSIFYHRFNLDKIAVMGHSAGGTASIEFCRVDSRCKAAIDLDGWYDEIIGNEPINKPLLLMVGSKSIEVEEPTPEYLKRKELTREQYFEREKKIDEHRKMICSGPSCSLVIIPDATHSDFGDNVLMKWPLRQWDEVDSYKVIDAINTHIVQFFNKYLPKDHK